MPMPIAYRHADRDWQAMLDDLKDQWGMESSNAAYTAFDAVLRAFRRRVGAADGLAFAALLPAIPRAIFVAGWDVARPPEPFAPRDVLTREVMKVREHHNLTPEDAIEVVARVVRRHVHQGDLDALLARLPEGAAAFWALPPGERVERHFP